MSYFLDFSNLTKEDMQEIKHIMKALSLDFSHAIGKYMNDNSGKIKVLGEMKNGEFIRDEIDENGVHEYKGKDGISRMMKEVIKNKEKKDNGD